MTQSLLNKYSIQLKTLNGVPEDFQKMYVYPEGYFYLNSYKHLGKDLEIKVWHMDGHTGEESLLSFLIPIKSIRYLLEDVAKGNMRYRRKIRFSENSTEVAEIIKPEAISGLSETGDLD